MKLAHWMAALAVCCTVASAHAMVTKVTDFTPAGTFGPSENPTCHAMVSVKYNAKQNESRIIVVIEDFLPNTTYGVMVDALGGVLNAPGHITTNNEGTGQAKFYLLDDMTEAPIVFIYIWDGDPDPDALDLITEDELRAIGF